MLPPTTYLPSIRSIATYPVDTLDDALQYLRLIYSPPVRGSRRRSPTNATGTTKSRWREDQLAAEALRNDTFERAYAIKWLSALIAQCGGGEDEEEQDPDPDAAAASDPTHEDTAHTPRPPTATRREALVETAAALLATCAGTASAGTLTRQFRFPVPWPAPDALPITIALTDAPLDNQDYGSVGAQTWGGACIMAEMLVEDPGAFGLVTGRRGREGEALPAALRCLELGAGTGLVSLAVSKVVERLGTAESASSRTQHVPIHIVATDYYPSVLENLDRNVLSNFPKHNHDPDSQPIISTARLDWSTFCNGADTKEPNFQLPFDVIYGADIIYEALHATWIKSCLEKLLRKPTSPADDPTFHLIIPLRATHAVESSTIEQVFPTHRVRNDITPQHDQVELVIKHKQIIICEAESGRQGEEVEYAYYRIGWGWS